MEIAWWSSRCRLVEEAALAAVSKPGGLVCGLWRGFRDAHFVRSSTSRGRGCLLLNLPCGCRLVEEVRWRLLGGLAFGGWLRRPDRAVSKPGKVVCGACGGGFETLTSFAPQPAVGEGVCCSTCRVGFRLVEEAALAAVSKPGASSKRRDADVIAPRLG